MLRSKPRLRSTVFQLHTFFGVCMICLLWLGINHVLTVRHETMERTATQSISTLSRMLEEHVTRALQEVDKTLLLLRAAYTNNPSLFDLREWVGNPQFKTELAVQYALIGPDGFLIASNVGAANARMDLSDREHFKVHVHSPEDKLFISKPVLGRASGKWSVQLTRKIVDASGHFAGVLVSSIDPYHLSRLYQSIDLGSQGAVTLVGFDGIIRARGGMAADSLGQSMTSSKIFQVYKEKPDGIMNGSGAVDGIRRLVSYRVVDGYPLIVTAAMAQDEIFASYRSERVLYLVTGAIITLLILGLIAGGIISKGSLDATLAALQAERDNAERANRVKSSFLAVMSHEIRTPMNAVLGLTTALLEGELSSEQRKSLQTIHESGDSLLEILNDILDYSKLEAGEFNFEHIAFAPSEIVESTTSIIAQRASAKGLILNTSFDPTLPAALCGDAGRLRQVLLNLLSNAIKFTLRGTVTVACRRISQTSHSATVEWSITDTGIGIAPERVGQLFNDFVQADCSINRRFGGSGLGLSICKRIVSQMNGEIDVKSVLGSGTTIWFRVTLPLAELAQPTYRDDDAAKAALHDRISSLGRPLRVLIADDNPTNRLVAAKMLQEFSAKISMAADGAEAVAAAVDFNFDVVFMDVRMPEMDGLDATRAIRARGNTVPIIAFTANAFPEDVAACTAAGMDAFVAKPVRKALLVQALVKCLGQGERNVATAAGRAIEREQSASQEPFFDERAHSLLAQEIGAEGASEAFSVFREETMGRLAQLDGMSLDTDREAIAREAHTIKGTAATFGLMKLAETARSLEAAANSIDPESYQSSLDNLKQSFAQGECHALATLQIAA